MATESFDDDLDCGWESRSSGLPLSTSSSTEACMSGGLPCCGPGEDEGDAAVNSAINLRSISKVMA